MNIHTFNGFSNFNNKLVKPEDIGFVILNVIMELVSIEHSVHSRNSWTQELSIKCKIEKNRL